MKTCPTHRPVSAYFLRVAWLMLIVGTAFAVVIVLADGFYTMPSTYIIALVMAFFIALVPAFCGAAFWLFIINRLKCTCSGRIK